MFEDQTVELLPARTTMKKWGNNGVRIRTGDATAANFAIVVNKGDGDVTVNQFANANTGVQVVED